MDNGESKPIVKDTNVRAKNNNLKENIKKYSKVLEDKKIQIFITLLIFSVILISSTSLRFQNLDLLKDTTTGKYLPSDPDACYELRVAQNLLENGNINGIDSMRNPGLNLTYTQELLPKVLVLAYKILNPINSVKFTLDYIDVLYPVIAFALSIIIFFILSWYISKSKLVGVLASAVLAYSPSYLSRTIAGISSHEALGMPFFFLALLTFVYSLKKYDKSIKHLILCGVGTGVSLALSVLSWAGASNFVLMIIPFSILIYYLFGFKKGKENLKKKIQFIGFNFIWIIISVLVMPLFENPLSTMYGKFTTNYGILIIFSLMFMIIDVLIEKYSEKLKFVKEKPKILFSLGLTIVLGILGLFILGKNPFSVIYGIYHQLLFPMGQGRVGLTVAYYSQPYLKDVISQYTPFIFWIFFLGLGLLGLDISKKISSKKDKIYFILAWIVSLFGLTFTRYSPTNLFDGTNFISQLAYFSSFLLLGGIFLYLYKKKELSIDLENIILFSWTIVMLLSIRSAVRVLFLVFSFVAIMFSYGLYKILEYSKKSKEELTKGLLIVILGVLIIGSLIYLFGNPIVGNPGNYQIVSYSAKYSGPIANVPWQNAMKWVRENTSKQDIFVHWWDYGYLIQLIGERTTVLDGGNANSYWNHLMGRYVLTTPFPETALSFMKTHNVSYLLIDPTDLGKYAAYSKIGSDDKWDRLSYLDSYLADESQTQETSNGTIRVYTGFTGIDEDIYISETQSIIPGPTYNNVGSPNYKAYVIGIIQGITDTKEGSTPSQPIAVVYYNDKHIKLPMRYAYMRGKLIDYKTGINATFFVYPSISQSSVNFVGAGIYLSPKVSSGLFAKLYLMNDPFDEYPTVKLAEKQASEIGGLLKLNNIEIGDFVYNNGFNGPIKIWKIDYPSNILTNEGFMKVEGEYAELDNEKFTR